VVEQTIGMVGDKHVRQLAQRFGLDVVDVTWEDTGRFQNSAVGDNISDMTIQVQYPANQGPGLRLACMPVIRAPNFRDLTCDIPPELFYLLVGNQRGDAQLSKLTLRDFLGDLRQYLHDPTSWRGRRRSLLAPRDTHVLVSAQACFLPIPPDGVATFNPVLFNYQSEAGDPAVLTILATREGTSVTVIDNQRDAFEADSSWGQRLFFHQNGQRASLTGQRQSDFVKAAPSEATAASSPATGNGDGLNMVLVVQVPLKQKPRPKPEPIEDRGWEMMCFSECAASDVEAAVIGHGELEGPFTEIDGLPIRRDERFPIRVTVQFYKATSNGVVSAEDMRQIAEQLARVYREADFVGSLVTDGPTGRPTEHAGPRQAPPDWWESFWQRHLANTGQTREQAQEMLDNLLGPQWRDATPNEVEQRWNNRG
jgi:hypothetical protein